MTAAAKFSPTGAKAVPVEKKVNQTVIRLRQGELCALEVDAFVFYARENLVLGSGYGTAIQMRGGLAVKKELEKIGSVKMGEAVITGGGGLPAKHIIHACGPKFQEADVEAKLRRCLQSALQTANDNQIKTLAFPPMGTGFYGVPLELSAKVMFETIKTHCEGQTSLEEVIICVNDFRDYVPFKDKMQDI